VDKKETFFITLVSRLRLEYNRASRFGYIDMLFAQIFTLIVSSGTQFFVLKLITNDNLGRIKIMQVFVGFGSLIGSLGINTAIIKFVSEMSDTREKNRCFSSGFSMVLISSVFLICIGYVLNSLGVFSTDRIVCSLLNIYLLSLPFMILNDFLFSFFQGRQQFHMVSRITIISKIASLAAIVGATYLFGIYGYLGAIVGVFIFTFSIYLFLVRDLLVQLLSLFSKSYCYKLFAFGRFCLAANLVGFFLASSDIILLNYLHAPLPEIGAYSVALFIIMFISQANSSAMLIALPKLSSHCTELDTVLQNLRRYERRNIILNGALFAATLTAVPWLLEFIFGSKFHLSISYLPYLLVGYLMSSVTIPKGQAIISLNRVDMNFYGAIIVAAANLCIVFGFIRIWGTKGAAIAAIASGILKILCTEITWHIILRSKRVVNHSVSV